LNSGIALAGKDSVASTVIAINAAVERHVGSLTVGLACEAVMMALHLCSWID
jgi:hypothetical protein